MKKWVDNISNSEAVFPFRFLERWGDLMKTNCEVLSWREGELFSFELINKLVRELSPIYRLNFYQLLLFFCQKIQLQLLLSFCCSTYVYFAVYLLLPTWFYISLTCFHLGKGSNNQNGNLRWFLPWRGGVSRGSRVPHTFSEIWFFWKPFRIIPWLWKRVLHLVWALYYVYIVLEMTLNMTE